MSVLIWTQHLLGTGHLRRSLALAAALADRRIQTTVATGGPSTGFIAPRQVRLVQLDAVHAADGDFTDLRDGMQRPWKHAAAAARAAMLADLLAATRPDVLVTELFPFGRRAFASELLPLIQAVRASGGKIVCSVRDILVASGRAKSLAMLDLAQTRYDRILVHGDERFVAFDASFPHAPALAGRLSHTGFIVGRPIVPAALRSGILVSAGGGSVGQDLLSCAAATARLLPEHRWHLVGGAGLGEADRASLQAILGPLGSVHRHVDNLPERLASCRLSVAQAGYNTTVEALLGATPMVLVPFAAGGETEQATRAARLAELGRAVVLTTAELDPARLAAAARAAMVQDARVGLDFSFDGAARSAAIIADLLP